MAKGFYAHRLQANCIDSALSGAYFNEATAHIMFGDQRPIGESPHTVFNSYCGEDMDKIKGWFPAQLPMTLAGPKMWDYGKSLDIAVLPSQMYFDARELYNKVGPWDYVFDRKVVDQNGVPRYKKTLEGWRFRNSMVALPLARKFSNRSPNFTNFTDVYWTDMSPYPNAQQPELERDWLGNLHNNGEAPSYPMMYSYGVRQPFLGEEYYENTNSSISKGLSRYFHNFMPFCSFIKIYDVEGTEIGYADGLAFQLFIFNGAVKNRLIPVQQPKILPTDSTRLLSTSGQYWSVELWIYLSVVKTKQDSLVELKSPRLHTHRWWYFTQKYGNQVAPAKPYFFMRGEFNSLLTGDTIHKIKFNLLNNQNNIDLNKGKAQSSVIYNTPWTDTFLYLTA